MGSSQGSWFNRATGESLHWDTDPTRHGGPHWDYQVRGLQDTGFGPMAV